jgi:hypothetical protein
MAQCTSCGCKVVCVCEMLIAEFCDRVSSLNNLLVVTVG